MDRVAIQWVAPEPCPDRSALIDELQRDLEGSQVPSARLVVLARVEQSADGSWRVTIETDATEGISSRVVSSHTCAALLDATSLIVAMMIDPETAAIHARAPTEASSIVPAAPSVGFNDQNPSSAPAPMTTANTLPRSRAGGWTSNSIPMPPPLTNPRQSTQQRPTMTFALGTGADVGSVPGLSAAVEGSAGLVWGNWRGEGAFGYWLPKSEVSNSAAIRGAGGRFGKLALQGRLCTNLLPPMHATVSPCVGMAATRFSGLGNDQLPVKRSGGQWVPELQFGALTTISVAPAWVLRLDLEVGVPLNRPDFGYFTQAGAQQSLYTPAVASVRGLAGLEVRIGL